MSKRFGKRLGAAGLAALMAVGAVSPALAAGEGSAACDEAYYATLDYYGGLTEGSVVKSYRLSGGVTDYGVYDRVENLTDGAVPSVSDGMVSFTPENGADRFYFEGKTAQPYRDLPWTIAVSYRLNGVPKAAEALAGEKGMVEILLDVTPNPNAPAYLRDNLVLTAATAFNADDILSLEAEGAEVQLVGNLRAVMYMVLPGEEQHFVIRVGSDSFTFSGLMLLAVPATLAQMEKVADLKQAKEKGEDSLDAIDESLDVILDTLEGMSGSLNATAAGLDQLNAVRDGVSAGKGEVYDKADLALSDVDALADTLGKLDPWLTTASQAAADTAAAVDSLTEEALRLKPLLSDARALTGRTQEKVARLKKMLETAEGYNTEENRKLINELGKDAKVLNDCMDELYEALDTLRINLKYMGRLSKVSEAELSGTTGLLVPNILESTQVTIAGRTMTAAELLEKATLAQRFQAAYTEAYTAAAEQAAAAGTTLTEAQVQGIQVQTMGTLLGLDPTAAADQAKIAAALGEVQFIAANEEEIRKVQANLSSTSDELINAVNRRIGEANVMIDHIAIPGSDLAEQLGYLCATLGGGGFTGDLEDLLKVCTDLMEDMEEYEGTVPDLLDRADEAGDLLSDGTERMDALLDELAELTGVLDAYEPELQAALGDVTTLSGSAQSALHDMRSALSSMEDLLRQNGGALDAGTRETLTGLAAALRKSTQGLDRTGTIRNAKDTINDLVDDQWDAHSGQVDGLLNIDGTAACVSLTDPRNPPPESVQFIMRTQEIKLPEEEAPAAAEGEREDTRTFWQRVVDMFVGIWEAITGFFSGKKD